MCVQIYKYILHIEFYVDDISESPFEVPDSLDFQPPEQLLSRPSSFGT